MKRKVHFMNTEPKYIQDLTEIRSMMERSTKCLSLTGWSGIMAGVYALAGAYIAYEVFHFNETRNLNRESAEFLPLFLLAMAILALTIGTAAMLSFRKASKTGERLWNAAARRLLINMAIPLVTGGILILIFYSKGFIELLAPVTLIFYGLALINASKFSYEEFKYLGLIEIVLGLTATYFTGHGLLIWALGFGVAHIIYGIYMHLSFEK